VKYAVTSVGLDGGGRKTIRMHRFILGLKEGELVDHINRDGLDNRRENLRVASHSQNMRNRRLLDGKSSKYRGVVLVRDGVWVATIGEDGKSIHLGSFTSEEEAAKAYDIAVRSLGDQHAPLNFPDEDGKQFSRLVRQAKPHIDRVGGGRVGVSYSKGSWMAKANVNKKQTYLGRFRDPDVAAVAYDLGCMALIPKWVPALNHPGLVAEYDRILAGGFPSDIVEFRDWLKQHAELLRPGGEDDTIGTHNGRAAAQAGEGRRGASPTQTGPSGGEVDGGRRPEGGGQEDVAIQPSAS